MTEHSATPSQTVGPFFLHGMSWIADGLQGSAPTLPLSGTVFDGEDQPVTDAVVEIWNPTTGWARAIVDDAGTFRFRISRPAVSADQSGTQHAPSLRVTLFARGLLRPVVTRMYFPGERGNELDPVLRGLDTERRRTLLALHEDGGLRFDVYLQGRRETVFFVA